MTAGAPTIGGLKRLSQYMAGQLSDDVNITGGTISGTTLDFPTMSATYAEVTADTFTGNLVGNVTGDVTGDITSEIGTFDEISITDTADRRGTFTVNGTATVSVANTTIAETDFIGISIHTAGGTPTMTPNVVGVDEGSGFYVKAATGDTSIYNYVIIG